MKDGVYMSKRIKEEVDNYIKIKSESGDTLFLPKEKAKEYRKAVEEGDDDKMEDVEGTYYIEED